MPTETIHLTDNAVRTSIRILEELFRGISVRSFAVRLWDGSVWKPDEEEREHCVLVLRHSGALRQMFLPPTELNLAEAYIFDDFDIEGDIHAVDPLADQLLQRRWTVREKLHFARLLRRLPLPDREHNGHRRAAVLTGQRHSKERDRHAVTYHYDISNEFFKLFLDVSMVYSCGYFESPTEELDAAQLRKLDYVCKKLRLQPGERLFDIGCGWGELVIHAAKHYGAKVLGITVSEP